MRAQSKHCIAAPVTASCLQVHRVHKPMGEDGSIVPHFAFCDLPHRVQCSISKECGSYTAKRLGCRHGEPFNNSMLRAKETVRTGLGRIIPMKTLRPKSARAIPPNTYVAFKH